MVENDMTFEEALGMIVDSVSDVEGLEDAFDVVRKAGTNTDNEDYKTMYEDLKEKYNKRFKEEITSTPTLIARTEQVNKKLTVEDLDFDARTE